MECRETSLNNNPMENLYRSPCTGFHPDVPPNGLILGRPGLDPGTLGLKVPANHTYQVSARRTEHQKATFTTRNGSTMVSFETTRDTVIRRLLGEMLGGGRTQGV